MGQRGGGLWVMSTSAFVPLQSDSNICLHIYKWEIQERNVSFHTSPRPWHPAWRCRPPPVADFWNSYLDEWLKLRHSQPESHHSYLRKNGIAVIFWCIACHPACKRDTLSPYFFVPPLLSDGSPMSCLGWLIRCHGITGDTWEVCPLSHPASRAKKQPGMLIWSDQ